MFFDRNIIFNIFEIYVLKNSTICYCFSICIFLTSIYVNSDDIFIIFTNYDLFKL